MNAKVGLQDIRIRTELKPGDLGYVMYLHGKLYSEEHDFGISFESYVGASLHEFYSTYDPVRDRVWFAEHDNIIVGFLFLQHRENNAAQLRYFLIKPAYRGIGLGKKMMGLFMEFLHQSGYTSAYLLTTEGLPESAALYKRHGFKLTDQKFSTVFGKPLHEQRYELGVVNAP
jgi:N-acetylglutamate synthase-like GNAT family acetyltransferase